MEPAPSSNRHHPRSVNGCDIWEIAAAVVTPGVSVYGKDFLYVIVVVAVCDENVVVVVANRPSVK